MSLTRKDAVATLLTGLVVLTFAATHQGWNVWLVGDSVRWSGAVILVLGALTCRLGSPGKNRTSAVLSVLGVTALVLGVLTVITGSLTLLSLLVLADVVLWAGSVLRHAAHGSHPATA